MIIFATRFSDLLKEHNYTQQDFAKKYGFSKNQIHYWLKNKAEPDFETLVKLCKIFEVSADYLLGLTDY